MDYAVRLIYIQLLKHKHGIYSARKTDNHYKVKFSMIHRLYGCIPVAYPTSAIYWKD